MTTVISKSVEVTSVYYMLYRPLFWSLSNSDCYERVVNEKPNEKLYFLFDMDDSQ